MGIEPQPFVCVWCLAFVGGFNPEYADYAPLPNPGICDRCRRSMTEPLRNAPTAEVCPHGYHSHEPCEACQSQNLNA
jgi:hypothetical protein